MVQQQSTPADVPNSSDHHFSFLPAPLPTGTALLPSELPAQLADRPATSSQVRVRTHAIRQVVVLEAARRLSDVGEDLDDTIQLALADEPRGVVCDLSAVLDGTEPADLDRLAAAGRHVRDWPGIPIVVACPDPLVRSALAGHPLGKHLIASASMLPALSAVLSSSPPSVERLRLTAHSTAPRAARDFVTRTLLDWRLGRVIPSASLMVGELVASSMISAGTDIDLSVAWHLGALRLTVRDHGDGTAHHRHGYLDLNWRRLPIVASLSRAFGVLPTAGGGKAVWAVLDAPKPPLPIGRRPSARVVKAKKSPLRAQAHDLAGPGPAGRRGPPSTGHPIPQHQMETMFAPVGAASSPQPSARCLSGR